MAFERRVDPQLELNLIAQEKYVASRDYQIIIAYRLGVDVEEIPEYQGHKAWYAAAMAELHAIEDEIRQDSVAWQRVLVRRNGGRPLANNAG